MKKVLLLTLVLLVPTIGLADTAMGLGPYQLIETQGLGDSVKKAKEKVKKVKKELKKVQIKDEIQKIQNEIQKLKTELATKEKELESL